MLIKIVSCSFGFVEYDSPQEAQSAFEAMSGGTVDGRQITLDYAAERGPGGGGRSGGGFSPRGMYDYGGENSTVVIC